MKVTRKDIFEFAVFVAIIIMASAVKEIIHRKENGVKSTIISNKVSNKGKSNSINVVFVDSNGTLHTDSECKGIKAFMTVDTVLIRNLRIDSHIKICSRCITESQLEELKL